MQEICLKPNQTKVNEGGVGLSDSSFDQGSIRISEDVVASIAGLAAIETAGVHTMSNGISEGWTKKISGKNAQRGVTVHIEEDYTCIDLRIIIKYGKNILAVCHQLQKNVEEAVSDMTGLVVKEINVKVEGIHFYDHVQKSQEPTI